MKINTTLIDGYENMTAEEKLKALEEFEIEEKHEGYVKKETFDKTASELAAFKKKQREGLSEIERLQAEYEDTKNQLTEELNNLKKEKQLGELTAKYLSLGYEETLATDTAKAYMNGDIAKVFENQKVHQSNIEQRVKTDLLKQTPVPSQTNIDEGMTKEKFRKMSIQERYQFSKDHPEEYEAIYK